MYGGQWALRMDYWRRPQGRAFIYLDARLSINVRSHNIFARRPTETYGTPSKRDRLNGGGGFFPMCMLVPRVCVFVYVYKRTAGNAERERAQGWDEETRRNEIKRIFSFFPIRFNELVAEYVSSLISHRCHLDGG